MACPVRVACTLIAMLAPHGAQAEAVPAAIGRISYGAEPVPGSAICTGVLVTSDVVLTAAHCVRDAALSPETIHFVAGWSKGQPTGRRGSAVILAGGEGGPGLAGLVEDVALVVLDTPFPTNEFSPLLLTDPGSGPFFLTAFDRATPNQLRRSVSCRPLAQTEGLIALDCPVVSGNSGAPLLQQDPEGWHVVAVMVASSLDGPFRSWAVVPQAKLRHLISTLGDGD